MSFKISAAALRLHQLGHDNIDIERLGQPRLEISHRLGHRGAIDLADKHEFLAAAAKTAESNASFGKSLLGRFGDALLDHDINDHAAQNAVATPGAGLGERAETVAIHKTDRHLFTFYSGRRDLVSGNEIDGFFIEEPAVRLDEKLARRLIDLVLCRLEPTGPEILPDPLPPSRPFAREPKSHA